MIHQHYKQVKMKEALWFSESLLFSVTSTISETTEAGIYATQGLFVTGWWRIYGP